MLQCWSSRVVKQKDQASLSVSKHRASLELVAMERTKPALRASEDGVKKHLQTIELLKSEFPPNLLIVLLLGT